MEYFDDDIISNMNRMEVKKKPNIFDDLLGGDDEAEQVNEEDDIFIVDEKRISKNELAFKSSYNKEGNFFEDENRTEEVIFGMERRGEDEREGEVGIGKSEKKKVSDFFSRVGGMDFQDFGNDLNELNDDFDNKFESNEDIFSLPKFNRETNKEEDEIDGEKKFGLIEGKEKDVMFQEEVYSKKEIESEENIVSKENDIPEYLLGINAANQMNIVNLNIENKIPVEEELQFEKSSLNNDKTASPYIQDNEKLNELNTSEENESNFLGKSESKISETNMPGEADNHSHDKNTSQVCMESNKVRESSSLQSSVEDIDWSKVLRIIENFEKQMGNSGRNQMLFKSIIYKLANNTCNN